MIEWIDERLLALFTKLCIWLRDWTGLNNFVWAGVVSFSSLIFFSLKFLDNVAIVRSLPIPSSILILMVSLLMILPTLMFLLLGLIALMSLFEPEDEPNLWAAQRGTTDKGSWILLLINLVSMTSFITWVDQGYPEFVHVARILFQIVIEILLLAIADYLLSVQMPPRQKDKIWEWQPSHT